jgi:6-phosphogluconolactonase
MKRSLLCALLCCLPAGMAWADGAVYAMTNALGNNQIKVYHRASNGNLTVMQTIATGGGGSGLQLAGVDSLGSAGSVQLDPSHHLLFVVNAESASINNGAGSYNSDCQQGTITSFLVSSNGMLTFANRVSSGGLFPDSLTVQRFGNGNGDGDENENGHGNRGRDGNDNGQNGDLLYVLNAGGPGACNVSPNVTGFQVDASGHMTQVTAAQDIFPGPPTGSGANCSAASAAGFAGLTGAPVADFACGLNPPSFARSPAQIRFTPDGNQLIVTVKGTSTIYVFPVGRDGRAGSPTLSPSTLPALPSYFGFTFDKNGHMLVTELFGSSTSIPAGAMGAISSFTVANTGSLHSISSHVGDGGTAACWIALEPKNGKYVYVANNLSATISSYSVGGDGSVTLISGTAAQGAGPNDLAAVTENGASFLYVVDAGTGTVGAFQINLTNGSLTAITGGSGLPTNSAQGLAAF